VSKLVELVVASGKGGTGKTSITASLATLAANHAVADCDVDAPNLHLLLSPRVKRTEEFVASKLASINPERCTKCGACREACRFDAIDERLRVDPILCEGCGVCALVCQAGAVEMRDRLSGYLYASETPYCPMAHARLLAGEANSGKLVTQVRQLAQQLARERGLELILVDGPPGIACPAIAAITGVTAGLLVAEPTVPAIHDLERALQLFTHFRVEAMVVINKFDLNRRKTREIEEYCADRGVEVVGRIPYDRIVTEAVVAGKPVVEHAPQHAVSQAIRTLWERIAKRLA